MRKRKIDLKGEKTKYILNHSTLRITKEGEEYFFEIGKETTSDIAEAVCILMRKLEANDEIWNMEVDKKINFNNLTPEKSLFWLTGGYTEWRTLINYNKPWCDCYLDFQEEFGFIIVNIVKKSKTLLDIRNGFIKYLNLPVLYNFAISRDMVR
jgi:hypothetical protein